MLANPGFECSTGTYAMEDARGVPMHVPVGWTVAILEGAPRIASTSIEFSGRCDGEGYIARIEGSDSVAFVSEDIETPSVPGKPFDAAVYQQVQVTPGAAYSLSAWMVSLCGGSASPNDCPEGYTMTKMLGIDPTGGTDPLAETVIWTTNSQSHIETAGWTNLRLGAVAQADILTVFGRIRSPFQWHGNHAFIDAFSLVRAPRARFEALPQWVDDNNILLRWQGKQSPDVADIPSGVYQLMYDVEYRSDGSADWVAWQSGLQQEHATFVAALPHVAYQFRLRARAEQLPGPEGAWPNHRYPGVWTDSPWITFGREPERSFLPLVER